jgi:hypothetical protein
MLCVHVHFLESCPGFLSVTNEDKPDVFSKPAGLSELYLRNNFPQETLLVTPAIILIISFWI